jgi:hypothetical protein
MEEEPMFMQTNERHVAMELVVMLSEQHNLLHWQFVLQALKSRHLCAGQRTMLVPQIVAVTRKTLLREILQSSTSSRLTVWLPWFQAVAVIASTRINWHNYKSHVVVGFVKSYVFVPF